MVMENQYNAKKKEKKILPTGKNILIYIIL